MAIKKRVFIKDISENVWRRVENCGYNKDLIMQTFKKYNYRLYDYFDEDVVREGVIKSGISKDVIEYNNSDFIVTESGYMSFDIIKGYMGIIFNPDDFTRVTVYSCRNYDVDVCSFKKNYEAKSEDDSLRLVSMEDSDVEDILAFGFVCLAVILEDCYNERNIYGR